MIRTNAVVVTTLIAAVAFMAAYTIIAKAVYANPCTAVSGCSGGLIYVYIPPQHTPDFGPGTVPAPHSVEPPHITPPVTHQSEQAQRP